MITNLFAVLRLFITLFQSPFRLFALLLQTSCRLQAFQNIISISLCYFFLATAAYLDIFLVTADDVVWLPPCFDSVEFIRKIDEDIVPPATQNKGNTI
jgi:hypothetical protein